MRNARCFIVLGQIDCANIMEDTCELVTNFRIGVEH